VAFYTFDDEMRDLSLALNTLSSSVIQSSGAYPDTAAAC
jgi:hypothetical protein